MDPATEVHGYSTRSRFLLASCAALLVALIYVSPHLAFWLELGHDYHYPFLGMADERHYGARIREAYAGNYGVGNPFLLEHKDAPYLQPPLPEIVLALLYRTFGLSVEQGMVVSDFVFPFVTFLLLYILLMNLTRSFGVSVVGSAFVMLSSIIILGLPQLLLELVGLAGLMPQERIPNATYLISRAVNNQLNIIPFLLTMISLHALYRGRGARYVVLGGVCQGFHYYVAPFYWGYVLGGSGLLCLYLLFIVRDTRRALAIILLNALGLALSIFFWLNVYHLMKDPVVLESMQRIAFRSSRQIFFAKRELLPVLLFLFLYRRRDDRYGFLAAFLVGGLVCENQQVITGKTLSNYHFIYTGGLMVVIAMVVLYENVTNPETGIGILKRLRAGKPAVAFASLIVAFLLVNAAYVQANYYLSDHRKPLSMIDTPRWRWKEYQALYEPFQWLSQHADPDRDVVLASEAVSNLLPLFTDLCVVVNRYSGTYVVPPQEFVDRWLVRFRFYGVSDEEISDFLERKPMPYNTPYIELIFNIANPRISTPEGRAETKAELVSRYRQIREEDLPERLAAFSVRYAFLSHFEEEEFAGLAAPLDLSRYGFLRKVYDRDGFRIYEVLPP